MIYDNDIDYGEYYSEDDIVLFEDGIYHVDCFDIIEEETDK